ncbi:MAG TPA: LysR family transcriptional regulator [Verrucomicrobiae bacterium]|nr:LysR family transcriptional regulator [Verrucomicrobiae bacterium]
MNEFLATVPFDLYALSLFDLVAKARSFTKAARSAGLTQSAVTRQIAGMETRLGVSLFERTTRHVELTPAGRLLHERCAGMLQSASDVLREVRRQFDLVPQSLRVGVARSIGLAVLPGYFFAFTRRAPKVQLRIVQRSSREILAALEANELDVGLVTRPSTLPPGLRVTHHFADEFTLIVPPTLKLPKPGKSGTSLKSLRVAFANQRWLLIDREGYTGRQLHAWLRRQGWPLEPAMELDNFDTIVNLVSLGMGVSLVPHRVLPLYEKRRAVQRVMLCPKFSRELAVVTRRNRKLYEPLATFVESILF